MGRASRDERIAYAAHVAPSPRQLAWQRLELAAFFHFTVNTFTDLEWGTGEEDPAVFNPTELDTRQWLRAASEAGFKLAILTAKHHDGFCLWPSRYTEHSIKRSPYRDGQGDVVREFVNACREYGVKVGFYLSPWDRHEPAYGTDAYNDYFVSQLTELLTNYGEVSEMWFDGACGEGPNGKRQVYDWERYYRLIRELQPEAVIAIAGPDVRWVGNESGLARENEWSVVLVESLDQDRIKEDSQHDADLPRVIANARGGDLGSREMVLGADRLVWYPAECDVSVRPGWFYHDREDSQVKSPEALVDLVYKSVGRNAGLLLNLPPDRRGLIHGNDVRSLHGMRRILDATFAIDLAHGAAVAASHEREGYASPNVTDGDSETYWTTDDWQETAELVIDLGEEATFDVVMLREHIAVGQRIEAFMVEASVEGRWHEVAGGGTVGNRRLLRCEPTTTGKVRVRIAASRFAPTLSQIGLYRS